MKCELCQSDWFIEQTARHITNGCPMAGVTTYAPIVKAINESIKWARDQQLEVVRSALKKIDPCEWTDGCGCCGKFSLDETDGWKALVGAVKGEKP